MADSGYTLTNVHDADDVTGERTGGNIEGRFLRPRMDSKELGVSYFRYAPGFRASVGHHHETQEEVYVVVGGSGSAKLGDDVVDLKRWDVLRVAPDVIRGFAAGPDGLEIIAVGGPKPEGGDGQPTDSPWPDEG